MRKPQPKRRSVPAAALSSRIFQQRRIPNKRKQLQKQWARGSSNNNKE